jgi:hypothetical protein
MKSRREFLSIAIAALSLRTTLALADSPMHPVIFKGGPKFNQIVEKATAGKWSILPIGQLMGKIANELVGTPYVAHTLELSDSSEICSANLSAVDCVTFVEMTLGLARMLKKGGRTPTEFLAEVAFLRYRDGKPGDYSTRLHYMSDWFADNEAKHVLRILSDLPGSMTFTKHVNFMSTHPQSYKPLAGHSDLIAKLKQAENRINSRSLKYVPLQNIAAIEPLLETGDIVGVCTSLKGLDIVHTGLIWVDEKGVRRFIDASSMKRNMRVTVEPGSVNSALRWSNDLIGAMFARPLDVS